MVEIHSTLRLHSPCAVTVYNEHLNLCGGQSFGSIRNLNKTGVTEFSEAIAS